MSTSSERPNDVNADCPEAIPPTSQLGRGRTLVLCFDGTGDQFDADNSNVVQLFSMLKKDDREHQMCYYQAGIGTYAGAQKAAPLMATTSKVLDQALAWDLDGHVKDGYAFLMQNYRANDRICMFGFSRGAYTARALAGMIHKVGLLPASNHEQVPFAYKMYIDTTEFGWKQSNSFKKTFSVDVQIEFIGVWDTVASVGLYPRQLPFTTSNTIVRTFRHALALDERRAKFQPNLWNHPRKVEQQLGTDGGEIGRVKQLHKYSSLPNLRHSLGDEVKEPDARKGRTVIRMPCRYRSEEELEAEHSERRDIPTDVEEVWFAGAHCDVGGGSVKNDTPYSLARISLRWMIRECFKTDTGIIFLSAGLRNIGMDPSAIYPVVLPRPTGLSSAPHALRTIPPNTYVDLPLTSLLVLRPAHSLPDVALLEDDNAAEQVAKNEEEHELLDATSPIYDQLSLAPAWWSLEVVPVQQRRQMQDDTWQERYRLNLGRGREVPVPLECSKSDVSGNWPGLVKVHRTVKMRMEARGGGEREGGYIPKAGLMTLIDSGKVLWVN